MSLRGILEYLSRPKSAITVYKVAAQTLPKTAGKITMDKLWSSRGDAFTMSNGGILVNRSCYVEVSGNIYSNGGLASGDTVFVQLYKNSTNLATICTQKITGTGAFTMPVTPIVVPVNKGDYIYLYAYNSVAARGTIPAYAQNRLTVVEI